MKPISRTTISWAIGFIAIAVAQKLPYNPTFILHDTRTKNLAYIFLRFSNPIKHQLVSLDYSTTLTATNISFNVISQDLPFSTGDATTLIPSISSQGDIFVYTGFCGLPDTSAIWRYQIPPPGLQTTGGWAQGAIHNAADLLSTSLVGTQFLTRAITFSTLANGSSNQSNIYVFGGMCPKDNATTATWQSAAHYSSKMIRLSPVSDLKYSIDITSSRGSAVAEAGFSITGLTPTYLNNSNIRTQKMSFVMIGGHNQNAFISMAQVAIWNLPEEAWNFVKVKMPLSIKPNPSPTDTDAISLLDSRSGHSSVLTEDGSKIIVFGGWVGDVSRAAEPQLVILNLGTGYGGSGDWEWSIPANQPSGNGVYGHGATLLPGNVMMIMGGSEISTTMKRNTDPGFKTMFFNVTSLTWISNYSNPFYDGREDVHKGTSSLGIRIAVGLGLVAVVGLVLMCVGFKHHKNKAQVEDHARNLSEMTSSSNLGPNPDSRPADSGVFPWSNRAMNFRAEVYENENLEPRRSPRYENIETSAYSPDDSAYILQLPKHMTAKASYSNLRGVYQPVSFENHGIGASYGTANTIHPIYEADENDEEDDNNGDLGVISGYSTSAIDRTDHTRNSDPFKDPQIQRRSPIRKDLVQNTKYFESDKATLERDINEWVTDLAEANKIMNSPDKSLSTIRRVSSSRRATLVAATTPNSVTGEEDDNSISSVSALTEKSQVASVTAVSRTTSNSNSKSNSIRSFIMNINPFNSGGPAAASKTTISGANPVSTCDRAHSSMAITDRTTAGSALSSRSVISFRSAQTSVLATSTEAEHLLSQPTETASTSKMFSSLEHSDTFSSGSPSKSKSQSIKTGNAGFIGGLKKVFASSSEDGLSGSNPYDLDCQPTEKCSSTLSFDKATINEPRRTVSASGSLWRRKQGRSDWDDSNLNLPAAASGCSSSTSSSLAPIKKIAEGEEDWDIERAVENRLVQVMFTIPKEKLRVVNQDVNEEKSESSSGQGSSSHMSMKALMRQSIKELSLKEKPKTSENFVEELAQTLSERKSPEEKGKQKVGGYSSVKSGPDSLTKLIDVGDLLIPMDVQKKETKRNSTGSQASKVSSRKSRVLEIVEQMESKY